MTKILALLRAEPRRLMVLAGVCAFLLGLPSVFQGFLLDDYVHRYAVRGGPGPMSGLKLFNFASGDPAELKPYIENGPYPWWTDPELRLVFFRPFSSALIYVDDALFHDAPAPAHLHSLLWSVAFVLAGALVLRRLLKGALFGAALLLFAFDDARWMPTAWLANRNALVAGTFALLSFALHLRWRQEGTRWAAPLSALSLAVGLCSAEAGLTIAGFFFAHALVERRLRSLLPLACVLIPYVAIYKLVHAGAHGSGIYIDPLDSPLAFALAAPGRLAALAGNLALSLPIDLWLTAPQIIPALIIAGGLTLLGAVLLLLRARGGLTLPEKASLDVLALGTLLALGPVLATFPASRLVMLPGIGAAGVLAIALRQLWRTRRFVVLGLLVFIHVPFTAVMWMLDQAVLGRMGRMASAAVAKTELETDRDDLRVVVITSGDVPTGLFAPFQRAYWGAKLPARYWILSNAPKAYRLVRIAQNALELEVVDGRFIETVFERVVRTEARPFFVGDQIQMAGAMVEVLVVDGWAPSKIRLTLDRSLEAEDVRLLVWRDGALRRLAPPAVGTIVELPFSEGVMTKAARPDD